MFFEDLFFFVSTLVNDQRNETSYVKFIKFYKIEIKVKINVFILLLKIYILLFKFFVFILYHKIKCMLLKTEFA